MAKLIRLIVVLFATMPGLAQAAINIFACEPEWAALAQELGGDKVRIFTATTALQDPHHIQARPSLIAKMRQANLVVCTGAELEVGWLPVLLRESGNSRVQPGSHGYFEAARLANLLERPARLDRTGGDIHPGGNPHIQGDPRNLLPIADGLAQALSGLDAANAAYYQARLAEFKGRWNGALQKWSQQAARLKGVAVVMQHRDPYLPAWLGVHVVAELEPLPGVEPSAAYLASVLDKLKQTPAKMVLRPAYYSPRPSQWLAERTGIPVVELPFSVGGSPTAQDLFGLYEDTLKRMLKAVQ